MAENREYYSWRISQRNNPDAIKMVAFVANTKDISMWAGIRRVGEHQDGIQRILKPARVKAIKKFFNADPRNTIPNSVILAFSPGAVKFQEIDDSCIKDYPESLTNLSNNRTEIGILSFSFEEDAEEHERLALIVDGQHRLAGMTETDEDLPIIVVALIDATNDEQAFQFVVVNNKARSVKTDNVKAIISDIQDENEFQERLANAGVNYGDTPIILREVDNRDDSPFKCLLNWPLNPDLEELLRTGLPIVNLTAIEVCLRYIRNQIPEVDYENDEDTILELFLAIWRVVAEKYRDLWRINIQFMSKVNINALNEYLVDRIENAWFDTIVDIYEVESVEEYVGERLEDIPSDFWTLEWTSPLQDNKVIRDLIKNDLKKIVRNQRNRSEVEWFDNLELVGNPD